ncbi:MAG: glutamate--tRNA ligase family protein, partial [bacterium]
MSNTKVVTRFAPSPTGLLHAGNYRTALFSYIFSLQNKGKFILRIEDTDKARSKKEYEDNIVESLKWLGIKYDEFYRQSDRSDLYASNLKKLIDSGHAYVSKEIPKEVGDREEVIRFKNPNKKISFVDIIRGKIEFDTTDLGDFIIARSMSEPVFHLVVVIDDFEMGITHIIRGEDHISNTPRHILIQEALGIPTPLYAHIPLLLAPDRSKMSKRKGALPITDYRDRGYLPNALINYMSFLGWNPGTEQEVMSFDEIINQFSLEKVQKAGAIFNEEKLSWFNKQYIDKMSIDDFVIAAKNFIPENISPKLLPLIKEKISKFSEIKPLFESELSFINP